MKKNLKITLLFLVAFSFLYPSLNGQEKKDSLKIFKNTIRVNLTSPMIFGNKYNVIGYERVTRPHQSFSVNIGRFSFPNLVDPGLDSFKLQRGTKDKGFTIAVDYRFYLKKENKYPAPRGIFIGPYYAFDSFTRTNNWSMTTETGGMEQLTTDLHLNINMIGGQLGYQFVIKKRVALDLIVMGPGIWFYNLKATVNTSLSANDEYLLLEKLNEMLASKFPGHEILLSSEDLQKTGSVRTSTAGFRYLVHIGFRF